MGIIVSSFVGCGKTYLMNTVKGKAKIMDATGIDNENVISEVMSVVDDYDIVFISPDKETRDLFNANGIDYDVFYPSAERRGEFIENQVRKRTKPNDIRDLDRKFEKLVKEMDDDENSNCYKHKLLNQGEFIGNTPIIMQYIDSINSVQNNKPNT